jgi:hypothetical protein
MNAEAKGMGFDPKKDSQINVNLISVAEALNGQVEMSEHELRELLKKVFGTVPSYHINAVARLVKKDGKESKFEGLARRSGGLIM